MWLMQETAGKMTKYICMAWVVHVVILDKLLEKNKPLLNLKTLFQYHYTVYAKVTSH